jgi:hypothetical protein
MNGKRNNVNPFGREHGSFDTDWMENLMNETVLSIKTTFSLLQNYVHRGFR